jgi:hypothetical protein
MSAPITSDGHPTFGLEPRYWRERGKHEAIEAKKAAAVPSLLIAAQSAVEVIHNVDDITPALRHLVMEIETRERRHSASVELLVIFGLVVLLFLRFAEVSALANHLLALF